MQVRQPHRYRGSVQRTFNFEGLLCDLFAGGGGASAGIENAMGRPVDFAVNHDQDAIKMHEINHPNTLHFQEDVFKFDPVKESNGRPFEACHLSPDCTHFSKARGGKPVEKKIRGLAWVAIRFTKMPVHLRPRLITVENVPEIRSWGPVTKPGKPVKRLAGSTFRKWIAKFKKYGYEVEWRDLKACDYGAPTTRTRFFLIARCDGRPIVWPEPTHGPGAPNPYRTAAEIIDWSIPCASIFSRKKPLVENTMKRIARGLQRFVLDNPDPFIAPIKFPSSPFVSTYYGGSGVTKGRGQNLTPLLLTQAINNRHALVVPFLAKHYGGGYNGPGIGVDSPLSTITAKDHHALVATHLIRHSGESVGSSKDSPMGTVMPAGLCKTGLVTSHMVKLRGTGKDGQSMTQPAPAITAGGLLLGEVRSFLMKYKGTDLGQDCRSPLQTITSKNHFGLVTIYGQDYQIIDIGMRMLSPRELYRAQAFPDDYVIDSDAEGNAISKTSQVARCGNSVVPLVIEAIYRANLVEQAEPAVVA